MPETRELRVAMVNSALYSGGAARMARALNAAMNEIDGVRSRLFHCEGDRRHDTEIGLRRPGARQLNALLARLGGAFAVCDLGVARELVTETSNDDVLHVHNLHGYYLNFERLLLAWRKRPIVWTWHDMWGATGRCGFSYGCDRWREGCFSCPSTSLYPAAWLDRARFEFRRKSVFYKQLERLAIVCPSDWLAEIALVRGFHEDQVQVIPNPVGTDCFQTIGKQTARRALDLPEKEFIPLFIASDCNDERKGYADFVACCEGQPWHPLVVGKPPARGIESMFYAGSVGDGKMLNLYYAAADVMVIPTYADNYPNTVIESLVSGTPVFGYDEGGVPSQLAPFTDCEVVVKSNWQGLRSLLIEFSGGGGKDAEMEIMLSQQARSLWERGHVAIRYRDLYKSLVSSVA